MKSVALDPLDAGSAASLAGMLGDPVLRASLFGGRGRINEELAARLWSPIAGDDARWAVRCVDSGRVVGGIGVACEQVSMFVGTDFQGQGYGQASLAALLLLCQARGHWSVLNAWTVRGNRAARRVFQATGWHELGVCKQDRGMPTLVHYCSLPIR